MTWTDVLARGPPSNRPSGASERTNLPTQPFYLMASFSNAARITWRAPPLPGDRAPRRPRRCPPARGTAAAIRPPRPSCRASVAPSPPAGRSVGNERG
eukprot:1963638-Prymnesium_polylepis.1